MESQKWFEVLKQAQNLLHSQLSQTLTELRDGGIASLVVEMKLFTLMGSPSRLVWLVLTQWSYPRV